MNVYEEAHNLARAIKDSNEFKEFDTLRKEVEKDEQLSSMLKDFQTKQLQIQTKQMSGEGVDQELMGQLQSMYAMLAAKPQAAQYLQAQMRFSIMMKDVSEILADAMNLKAML
jgi:cell fate (sporulation/competence/biofilm development) regulator YlbF (YheA/YmcA/DUF963 family)